MIPKNVCDFEDTKENRIRVKFMVESLLNEQIDFTLIRTKVGISIFLLNMKENDPQLVFVRAKNHAYYKMEEVPDRDNDNSTNDYS